MLSYKLCNKNNHYVHGANTDMYIVYHKYTNLATCCYTLWGMQLDRYIYIYTVNIYVYIIIIYKLYE